MRPTITHITFQDLENLIMYTSADNPERPHKYFQIISGFSGFTGCSRIVSG
jgi:hypothetical protein